MDSGERQLMKMTLIGTGKKIDWPLLAILLVSFCLLFLFLGLKPPQHDEGVNGWFADNIQYTGFYQYDAAAYHGPLHYYLLYLFKILIGRNAYALRLSAVLFGFFGVFLITRFRPYIGKTAAYAAAGLAAVSPGMTFYSRYAIHESGLFFFGVLTLLGIFRLSRECDRKALWFTGLGVTGMILMKETYLITISGFVFSSVGLWLFEKFSPYALPRHASEADHSRTRRFHTRDVADVVWVCLALITVFYSGFFLHWQGVVDLVKSFWEWIINGASERDGQKGFWKPFAYWLQLFLRYEWPAFLGLFCCYPVFLKGNRWHRFLALNAAITFFIYGVIPYKTPWCVMQIIWPLLFVAGSGIALFFKFVPAVRLIKLAALAVLTLLGLWSFAGDVRLNFFRYVDDQEAYVDIQTYPEIMDMTRMIREVARKDPRYYHMPIQVFLKAYWPMSWLLGDFTKVSYYTESMPFTADGDVLFVDAPRKMQLEFKLTKPYYVKTFRLNPAHTEETAYFDTTLFRDYFDQNALKFQPIPREKAGMGEGLRARWYDNVQCKGRPFKEELMGQIDFGWEKPRAGKGKILGLMLDGQLYVPVTGDIKFFLASDDGSEFFIDNKRLIDNSGRHTETMKEKNRWLEKGWHTVYLRYNDTGGSAMLRLWWQLPGREPERISPQYLKPGNWK